MGLVFINFSRFLTIERKHPIDPSIDRDKLIFGLVLLEVAIVEIPANSIRLAETAKQQLMQLKKATKIENWNILCRWALCISLAEPSTPSTAAIPADSNVEMTWSVFGGEIGNYLAIALKQRCHDDGLGTDAETLKTQLRLHLHRGIGYLAGNPSLKKIDDLVSLVRGVGAEE